MLSYPSKPQRQFQPNPAGFTLIELMLSVLIMAILSGVVLTMLNSSGVRAKARDAQRISDINKIRAGLELYFADNRTYPTSAAWLKITGTDSMSSALTLGKYLSSVPVDPLNTGADASACSNPTSYRYNYKTTADGASYILTAITELSTSNDESACATLFTWGGSGCDAAFATSDVCYGVEAP